MSKYIKYVIKRTGLPIEFRNRVLGYLKSSHQPDALKLHLLEPNETDETLMRCRYVAMFKTKEDARAFVNDWNDVERRKAHVDSFIVRKNVVLVFLKNQMRPGVFADQLVAFGFNPIYLFSLHETYRSIQNQITKCKIRYKVMWIDDNIIAENTDTPCRKPKRKNRSPDASSMSSKNIKRKYQKREKIVQSRSRSRSLSMKKNFNESLSKMQEGTNIKFKELQPDQMYEYIFRIGQSLTQQMHDIRGQLKGFFKLVQVANEAIDV